jgi:two-component system nitrogen regulation response regulator NtrX
MKRTPSVLVVDDEDRIREAWRLLLEAAGWRVLEAAAGSPALELLRKRPVDVLLLDLRLPDVDGLEVLERVVREQPETVVVVVSGHGTLPEAVRSIQLGAFDFLEKPVSPERLQVTLQRAAEHGRLLRDLRTARADSEEGWTLIGRSPAMRALKEQMERAAPSTGWILIEGENGTGKELVARWIHRHSRRAQGPFVRLNCAALPRDLAESELFGYEPGAFTGATRRHLGRMEQADGGTLFLDEVADMDPAVQAKLLRALSTGEVERLGGSGTVSVDIRLICATNRSLKEEVARGRFREDLFYRICVIPLRVPPLRERGEDILELARHFLGHFAAENGRRPLRLEPAAEQLLLEYPWPGNVRELKNLMERLVILHPRDVVTRGDLAAHLIPVRPESPPEAGDSRGATAEAPRGTLRERMEAAERRILQETLSAWGWNVSRAAQALGVDRATLHRRLRRLGLRRPGGPASPG